MSVMDEEEKIQYAKTKRIMPDYDSSRISILHDSLELIQSHPIRGAGLGAILEHQKTQSNIKANILDNTPLWILTEIGPFGLFAFLWVYLAMLRALYVPKKDRDCETKQLRHVAFWMLIIFGAFSLFHEILYTRFMWFILGMALVKLPYAASSDKNAGSDSKLSSTS